MLDKETIQRMIYLKTDEQKTDSAIARLLGVSRGTVIKYLKDNLYIKSKQNEQFVQQYKEIKQNEAKEILDIVRSEKYSTIAINIVSLFDKESLKIERDTRGIRNLTALLGNTIDKTIALKRLAMEERKVDIAERTLELKEQELQARLDNPDAFSNIVIIDDTEKAAIYYKENGIDTPYAKHTN